MKSLFVFTLCLTIFSNCTNPVKERPKTPEELRFELQIQESNSPLTYLSVKSKMRTDKKLVREAGLFRDAEYEPDGKTIYGTIKNSASIAQFKDIVLTVTFLSKTKSIIESKDYTIYEFYKPNSENHFELKVYPPDAEDGFSIEVKNAVPVN